MADTAQTTGQENTETGSTGGDQATDAAIVFGNKATAEDAKPNAEGSTESTDGKQADGVDGDKGKEGEGEKTPEEVVPEKYDLKAPEGFQLDEVLLAEFEPLAKELKLSNEGAQKLVETMMPKIVNQIVENHQRQWTETVESWVGEIKSDKEIGGDGLKSSTEAAEKALAKFGTPGLSALLGHRTEQNPKGLGLGNHPELVRVFARIGKAMADDTFHNSNSGASGEGKAAADVLFGGNN